MELPAALERRDAATPAAQRQPHRFHISVPILFPPLKDADTRESGPDFRHSLGICDRLFLNVILRIDRLEAGDWEKGVTWGKQRKTPNSPKFKPYFKGAAVEPGAAETAPGADCRRRPKRHSGSRPNMVVFDRKHKALQKTETAEEPSAKVTAVYLGIAARYPFRAGIIAVQIAGLPGGFAVGSQESEAALLTEAHRLLSQGDVAQRQNPLDVRRSLSAAPAWHSRLRNPTIPTSCVPCRRRKRRPRSFERRQRWYRKWYDLAVQSGLEMDAGQLQRIINAMQKH